MSALVVARVTGLVTVQDAGRPGFMHLGVPPGGPLSPSRFAAANAAIGNDPRAAGLEILGAITVTAERAPAWIAADGEPPRALDRGDSVTVASTRDRRVRYLAVAGGIDVPIVFGGRGTLAVAGLGGLDGRALRAGDRLGIASAPASAPERARSNGRGSVDPLSNAAAVRVVPGPDPAAFEEDALYTLCHERFRASSQTDRVGTRLDGPRIGTRRDAARRSAPMVRGGIQVPPDGRPIVLGPDHPTTGGYPLVAVIVATDVERVVAASVGAPLTFRLAGRDSTPA
jgi:biotin-dependent carboxylase-like uncharacterized protein